MLCGGAVKTFGGYYLGELIHKYWNNNNFLKHVEKRVHYLMPHFKEKPFWSIWLSQFIMGVNYLVIIFCGYNKVNYKTYLKADLSSTLVWAPLLLSLGYFFGQTALSFSKEISRFSLIILILIIIFLLFDKLVAYFYSFLLYFKKENMHLEENKDEKK
jgi:membrane protein DedA with SNARE-associated domain